MKKIHPRVLFFRQGFLRYRVAWFAAAFVLLASGAVVGVRGFLQTRVADGQSSLNPAFARQYDSSRTIKSKYQVSGNALEMHLATHHGDVVTTVGDPSGSDFVPDFTVSRLGGAAAFSLRPDISAVPSNKRSYSFSGNSVSFHTPQMDYVMYDTTTPVFAPGGKKSQPISYQDGYEYEFVLNGKPASNVITSPIQTQGLDFYYQPPLNVEMASSSCSATDCGTMHRPENVVGSYAVYYSGNKTGDYSAVGGKNYGTGKAFQIYRPKAIDAAGNWTWCDLRVDPAGGQMAVTVPQKFLDSASYPVTVDPTFGYTTVGASNDSGSPNTMLGSVFTGAAGTMASITAQIYPDSGYPYQFAIYDSNLGLVGNSAASSGSDSTQNWYTLNVSGSISAANYWLLLNTADTQLYFYYDTGATNQGLSKAQTYGTWPSSFSSPTYNTRMYSIYATYTASGGGGGSGTPPTYNGSGTFTANTVAITPPYPASMQAGDVCLLVVTSENQAISLSSAQGFVQVPWSPQYAGTAASNPASRLAVYWKRTVGGDTAPTVADSGNNTEGQIHCFSGVINTGNPWDVGAGGNDGGANDTSGNIPGATTTVDNDLVVLINSTSYNGTSQTQFSGWTNANLSTLTEQTDNSNTAGLGGGHGMATGIMATAGNYGTTTVTLAATSYKGAISIALKPQPVVPGVAASLGKTADGWSGAIPVTLTLTGGLSSSTYPYARAKVVTPASQTFYATTTWNASANAYTGTIYPGSNYCAGCADPTTGTFNVIGQISTSSSFSPVAYESSAATFSTFITRRWNAVSTSAMGNSTQLLESYNSGTGLWTATVSDMTIYSSGTHSNTAVAFPFLPTTANISMQTVTLNGAAVSQGSAASTTNAWWWDSNQHALYVQAASLGTTHVTVAMTFTSDTDLWATRVDELYTANISDRLFYNGLMIGNQYVYTTIFGGGFEGAGEQVELTGHDPTNTNDVNLDCMERAAVHVDNTIRTDASAYYSADIKWSQNEWQSMVTSQNNNQIVVTVDSTGSDWAQQANNGIFARRTQTYYASKRYILNTYQFTNNGASAHRYPFVWEREQWLGTDQNTNDRGRYAGDSADEAIETSTSVINLPQTWEVAYDAGIYAAMGVIFHDSESASTTGYLVQHPFLSNSSPYAEWPVVITSGLGTENDDTGFSADLGTVQPGNSVTYNFWQWGGGDFTSVSQIQTAIASDFVSTNPPSTMTQAAYRFFNNTNSTDVGTALAAQNTPVTLGSTGAQFRVRVLNYVTSSALAQNRQFKLQYASMGTGTCLSPQGSWTDVSTSTPIAFYANGGATSGSALTANANDPTDGANVIVNQTYQSANPFVPSQGVVGVGQDGKWDFSLYDNGSPQGTAYCLRTVWSDNTPFSSYTNYPQVTTASSGTVSCSTNPASISFGTLSPSAIVAASSNATTTMSCTYAAGCTLYVQDAGSGSSPGLWASAASYLISSANSTLAAGTEGYGIQAATTAAGSGAALTLASAYHQTGNTVGGLSLTQTSLASSTGTFTGREVVVVHKAAISGMTPQGSYVDTITYSCVGN